MLRMPKRGPSQLPDLDEPSQIAEMVRRFYAQVDQDDLLGPMFNDVAQVEWPKHLEKLTAFWSRALLSVQGYQGNPFRAHLNIHNQCAFTLAHFERWLTLFHQTLEAGWRGPNADQASDMARKVGMMHAHQLLGDKAGAARA